MEPFKNLLSAPRVQSCAMHLAKNWPAFDAARFEQLALNGLEALEMKARAMQIADALEATLPDDFPTAATVIEASLAPVIDGSSGIASRSDTARGLAGWIVWPLGEYIARRGVAQPERALQALHALTQRFTAEWAIRPFLLQHPELTFATMLRWTQDPSVHVRRLVSEGSRPRLPWGIQLKFLVRDPSPTLPLLQALLDDPAEYVRLSVANHLNDIAKDHPERVADWLERYLPDANAARTKLLKHASRSLIKQGHPGTLALWGAGEIVAARVDFELSAPQLNLGEALGLVITVESTAKQSQKLLLDYVVHHVKANGSTSPKVFKGWVLELQPGEIKQLRKTHWFKPITTRRYFSGTHRVELIGNGAVLASAAFTLTVA